MRLKSRERFLRLFISSLANSELSREEIREVIHSIRYENLNESMAHAAEMLLFGLGKQYHPEVNAEFEPPGVSDLLEAVQAKRLKKDLVSRMITQTLDSPIKLSQKMTVREMLEKFATFATAKEYDQLIYMINGDHLKDPYFRGISQRQKS